MNDLPTVRWLLRVLIHPGWAPLAVIGVHLVLAEYGLTHRYDHLLHFLGGVSIAYFIFGVLRVLPEGAGRIPGWTGHVLAFTASCTVAVFWEFGEFASDRFMGTSVQQGVPETMLDLAFGIAGALAVLVLISLFRGLRISDVERRRDRPLCF